MSFLVAVIVLTSTSCTMIGASEFETPSPEITDNRPESGEVSTDDAVASLEDRRRELELPTSSELSMSIADAGSLEWPLDGDIIYRFGQEQRPAGLVLNWNGVGSAGLPGSPVRAARNGLIVLAGPFEGYGPSVVLSHGDGFYSLYLYLEEIRVAEGRSIDMGHVIGTVGGTDTAQGPHIEFQVRAPIDGGVPAAQDPLEWLKPRAGG